MCKVKIFLVEDNLDDINRIQGVLNSNNFEVVNVAQSLSEAVLSYKAKKFDLAIIDIFLKGQPEGIMFARYLSGIPFIFLTSSLDKTIFNKAKISEPHSYLIKPFNELELIFAIELAIDKMATYGESLYNQNMVYHSNSLFVKKKEFLAKVQLDDIYFVTVEGQYSKIVTKDDFYIIHMSLTEFILKFTRDYFIRTHRNYLVNVNKISKVYSQDNLILLDNNKNALISRRFKKAFFEKYIVLK